MDAIVTGGAGFIGSHVADALLERGDRVAVIDNLAGGRRDRLPAAAEFHEIDIRDADAMRRVFDQVQPQAVFHLAAQADVRVSVEDPALDGDVNVLGTSGAGVRPPKRRPGGVLVHRRRALRRGRDDPLAGVDAGGADGALRHLQVLRRAVPRALQPAARHAAT